uniref:G-protein coupled receptors family 1 profile domain-containing protein n=1 Tax=Gopherus agassizii TaxID=38772 RepID=A0A452H665_9SAUR
MDQGATHLAAAMLLFTTLPVGVVGNGLYLWVLGLKMRRMVTKLFFLHLVSCYLLFTLLIPFFAEVLRSRWPFGQALCKLHSFTRYLVVFAGVFVLTLISLHRCLLVAQPVWVRNHHRPRLGCWLITGAWILAICFSIPYLVVRDVENKRGESFCVYRTDLRHFVEMPLRLSRFLGGFLVPFAIIATSYVVLIWKLRRRSWVGSQRTFALVLAVVALFFVCWLPHHVLVLLSTYQNKKEIWGVALKLANALAYLHSCLNPVLYGLVGFTRSKGRRRGSFLGIFRRALAEEEEGSSEMEASQSTRRTS